MKTAKDVKRIVIAGAGTMGSSMGETFAKYGYDVTLYDVFPEALKKAAVAQPRLRHRLAAMW